MATTLNGEAKIILSKTKKPMTAKQIYKEVIKRGNLMLITETPIASLSSSIYKDIKKNGRKSIFIKCSKLSDKGNYETLYSLKC